MVIVDGGETKTRFYFMYQCADVALNTIKVDEIIKKILQNFINCLKQEQVVSQSFSSFSFLQKQV